ncbi:MAG: uroporphyrinogen-III C-methyltransferase [Gammaproteobacteria bacterium]
MDKQNQNKRILITRPQKQAQPLAEQLQLQGDVALFCPTLEIQPLLDEASLEKHLATLDTYHFIIFVSPNAVWQIIGPMKKIWPKMPSNLQVAAIGLGTKNALMEAGIHVHLMPTHHFSSEGLLALPAFKKLDHKKLLLITGEQGRDVLNPTLTARGAIVTQLAVYRSIEPHLTLEETRLLKSLKFDIIVATSALGLKNLIAKAKKAGQTNIQLKPLLLISERLAKEAKILGFTSLIVAKNATTPAILNAIELWKTEQMTEKEKKQESAPIENTKKEEKKRTFNFSCILTFFALILSIGAIVETSILLKKAHYLKQALVANKQTTTDNKKQFELLANKLDELSESENKQEKLIEKLANSTDTNTVNWVLSELKYLVQQAQIDLNYEYNIDGAFQLLQLGLIRLESQANAQLIPVEKNLKDSIALLKAIPQINKANLLDKLTALSNQVVELPLVELKIDANTHPSKPVLSKNTSFWDKLWKNTWYELQKLIVIKRHEQLIHPLLSVPQQDVLVKNIQFLFAQAKWATLYNNQDIYQTSLMQAVEWIKKYFVTTAGETQDMLNEIAALQKINLKSHLPDLSETQNLIDQLRSQVVKENTQ